jgi:hypothetical protein
MELYGDEATVERAKTIEQSINTAWTKTFADGYSVTCNITVTNRGPGSRETPYVAQIETLKPFFNDPSNVNTLPGMGNKMTLNANNPMAFTCTCVHEFGHVIGLEDRYSESITSKISGTFGGARTDTIQPGYEGNLMGVSGGNLGNQNLADLSSENEPSPYWIYSDDHIRNWVNTHSPAEIGRLPSAIELRAIETLMGGWISDDDMAAIGKICSNVATPQEGNIIRNGVDLLDFSSLGQPKQMRVFFTKMR